jgi:hypothetical protein
MKSIKDFKNKMIAVRITTQEQYDLFIEVLSKACITYINLQVDSPLLTYEHDLCSATGFFNDLGYADEDFLIEEGYTIINFSEMCL